MWSGSTSCMTHTVWSQAMSPAFSLCFCRLLPCVPAELDSPLPCSVTEPWPQKLFLFLSAWGQPTYSSRDNSGDIFVKSPTPPTRVTELLLLRVTTLCWHLPTLPLSFRHVIINLGLSLPHLPDYLYPNAGHMLVPWSGLVWCMIEWIYRGM